MKWISVKERLPEPWQVVWIFWRNKEVLLGCRMLEGAEVHSAEPEWGWYSFDHEKCKWARWWQPVDGTNYDKPEAPHELD